MAAAFRHEGSHNTPISQPFVVTIEVLTGLRRFTHAASNTMTDEKELQQLLDKQRQKVEDGPFTLSRHALAHDLVCGCMVVPYFDNPSKSVPKCTTPSAMHARVLRAIGLDPNGAEE
ncbi:hypothetical protein BWQ96_04628 [Gracilariopsis chorda]|uniref:Uncharacterized protein n=1 Tax=Gracilariopsis chorda TaxID=448386 RepID=A0A2V3IU40_9FLOR|nr:hypothetical protein BWQ96_04628 [Gracilariopsis chorda]|eukprot:PXF45623.1 hypothetical protein BWQ96_04628 [Gracilariopsis chorda]